MNKVAKLISLLFYSSDPISHKQLNQTFATDTKELTKIINDANNKLQPLGLVIIDNATEAVLTTQAGFASLIDEFYETNPQPLSQSALEVLSIVAYKQPISKAEIDEIRGVSSEQSIKNLLNKQLIKKNSDKPEAAYHTTTKFLNAMGIKDINELPKPTDGITKD